MNARPITACALALAFLALSGGGALAQDRGQNRDRRSDTTRGRRDTTPAAPTPAAPTPAPQLDPKAQAEQDRRDLEANRRILQGAQGRTPAQAEQDRRAAQAEQDRRAAQAEQDRRAAQGRNNDQDRNRSNDRDRSYNPQDRDRNDRDRSYSGQDRNDRDRSYSGQDRRFPRGDPTFTDRDRQVTRDWYRQHRNRLGAGWRDRDRLSPSLERRLRRGQRLDPTLRQRMYWLPPDLAQMYGPPPRGYRYAIIGGNIVLIDDFYTVHDVFRLEINF
jgi:hypothetical protein